VKRGRCETSGEGEWKIFTDNQGVVDFVRAEDESGSNTEGASMCRSS
jgi:hypothetical protein